MAIILAVTGCSVILLDLLLIPDILRYNLWGVVYVIIFFSEEENPVMQLLARKHVRNPRTKGKTSPASHNNR